MAKPHALRSTSDELPRGDVEVAAAALLRERRRYFTVRPLKCLWKVFIWGFGVLFLSCACVSVSGVLFSVGMCVCVTC